MVEAKRLAREDFTFITIIGQGAYGRVAKAKKNDTGELFAIKIVEKTHLQRVDPI
jgi:serine/threonine protein kinase